MTVDLILDLFYAAAGSFLIGVWIAACCVALLWWNGSTVTVSAFVQLAILAGLCTLLLAEIVVVTR